MAGFAAAVSEKGYAAATIADIVRHARVSKRSFYEHFEDKEDCLLASYAKVAAEIQECLVKAVVANEGKAWTEQLDAVLAAYVAALEVAPSLTRACLMEMAAAGPRARKLRREVHESFARLLREFVKQARAHHPELRPISATVATAIVGGIDELLLAQVEKGPQRKLSKVRDVASELIRAVVRGS